MISLPSWLRSPVGAISSRLGGTRWVEPSNDITRAVYSSLRQPAVQPQPELAFDSLEFESAMAPATPPAADTPAEAAPSGAGREAA